MVSHNQQKQAGIHIRWVTNGAMLGMNVWMWRLLKRKYGATTKCATPSLALRLRDRRLGDLHVTHLLVLRPASFGVKLDKLDEHLAGLRSSAAW